MAFLPTEADLPRSPPPPTSTGCQRRSSFPKRLLHKLHLLALPSLRSDWAIQPCQRSRRPERTSLNQTNACHRNGKSRIRNGHDRKVAPQSRTQGLRLLLRAPRTGKCHGPSFRIRGDKPWGKNLIRNSRQALHRRHHRPYARLAQGPKKPSS